MLRLHYVLIFLFFCLFLFCQFLVISLLACRLQTSWHWMVVLFFASSAFQSRTHIFRFNIKINHFMLNVIFARISFQPNFMLLFSRIFFYSWFMLLQTYLCHFHYFIILYFSSMFCSLCLSFFRLLCGICDAYFDVQKYKLKTHSHCWINVYELILFEHERLIHRNEQ